MGVNWMRRSCVLCCAIVAISGLMFSLSVHAAPTATREVVKGISTERVVEGEPYRIAGKRVVFDNWFYIQPGDLDWHRQAGDREK